MSGCWIFQSNPKRYDLDEDLRTLERIDWTVRRYQNEVQPGDLVFVWKSGDLKERGIWAVAKVTSEIKIAASPPHLGGNLWRHQGDNQVEPRVELEYVKKLDQPLLAREIRTNPALNNLLVIRQPNGTNFRVSEAECEELRRLLAV